MELVVVADLAAERARRARKAREDYAAGKDAAREKGRLRKAAWRAAGGAKTTTYDVDDYVQEWEELTYLGRDAASIVNGSRPSYQWFLDWVRPRVTVALCPSCRTLFNPQTTGTLTVCDLLCYLNGGIERGRCS